MAKRSRVGDSSDAGSALACAARTAKGTPCRNRPAEGSPFCWFHAPRASAGAAGSGQGFGGGGFSDPLEVERLLRQILDELVSIRMAQATPEPRPDDKALRALMMEKVLDFLQDKLEFIRRRVDGEYEVDEWGRDEEFIREIRPLVQFFYYKYWRVSVSGLENVPSEGRALLVANHSGVIPWDALMIATAVAEEHPRPRPVRGLHLTMASEIPVLNLLMARLGMVQALPENAARLLAHDELALVFPEGVKGIGKLYKERYQLARFGRGGFVRVALQTKSPIIPVSVVGAEEIHPHIHNLETLASLLRVPYAPVTPTFPALGPLGLIPLPTKWYIHFDRPIEIQNMSYRPSEEPLLVSKLTTQVRDVIQRNIWERLKKRKSVFR